MTSNVHAVVLLYDAVLKGGNFVPKKPVTCRKTGCRITDATAAARRMSKILFKNFLRVSPIKETVLERSSKVTDSSESMLFGA